ncbi:MAG: hypothetical protein IKE29_16280 [Paenibacillus sp.]|uniref:hypothetical protein n=1 Tax=Paenibacillus sp. TaxID=58172 RepID=UPI0025E8F309|nr:hypothetical protein [Paenibacillus sp.]MBR2566162.1 hypothetical protein [Paenibacillus sp.]
MDDNCVYEEYTLILKHELVVGSTTYQMDEPLVIKHIDMALPNAPKPMISNTYLLNEMMDKMKHELLQRAVKND